LKLMDKIMADAACANRRIVLSEGEDARVLEAALKARELNIARLVLVGDRHKIAAQLDAANAGAGDIAGIDIHDPAQSDHHTEMVDLYCLLRKHKGITLEAAQQAVLDPHVYAALLVKLGQADGTLGGAITSTAQIVRTALQVIGTAQDAKMVSSFFLMLLEADHHEKKGAIVFSDAGLVIDPDAAELSQIAHASAVLFSRLTGETPRVALLSFSTKGSAKDAKVSKVVEATALLRTMAPDILVDGELQFDAAFVPDVARAKAPHSVLGGDANVFVFPNLDAGNIGYKIAQRIGGAIAIGPVLQGLAQPSNDLSRGCTVQDIVYMIAVTAVQCDT